MQPKFNGYFDNAATSFPKPVNVSVETLSYLNDIGGPYGRSFYQKSLTVSSVIEETRTLLGNKFHVHNSDNLVFTHNATHAINTVLKGLDLTCNSEILISPLEHNAVMRPLLELKRVKDITFKLLDHYSDGLIDVSKIKSQITKKTALIIVNHQSNVNGLIQPIELIKKEIDEIPLFIDAAQSAGHIEININKIDIDYLAFTGHKGLLGPTGTGGIYIKNPSKIKPFVDGGTGSNSEEMFTPSFMPDKFEAGTHNISGIFGLYGALNSNLSPRHTHKEFIDFLNEVKKIKGYTVISASSENNQGELFSIIPTFMDLAQFGGILDSRYGVQVRAGLHCAPLAHTTLKTYPAGTVRIAPSIFHTADDFKLLVNILKESIQN